MSLPAELAYLHRSPRLIMSTEGRHTALAFRSDDMVLERRAGDYEGRHHARITGPNAHECEPWMLLRAATIGSYCGACGRRWPWIEQPPLYFGGP
jgi:hypothetical protein